jgi:hypothetical protein
MGATAVLARFLVRIRLLVPIIATLALSLLYSLILFVAFNALERPDPGGAIQSGVLLPSVIYDTVLAAPDRSARGLDP